MPQAKEHALARLIKERRTDLGLSQRELAGRIGTSPGFISQLEVGRRGLSVKRVAPLAQALSMDQRELFWTVNPGARAIVDKSRDDTLSAWEQFSHNSAVRRSYHIRNDEMELLSCVASLGEVRSAREFIFILNAVRYAVGR